MRNSTLQFQNIVSILPANTRKSVKFRRFESAQNLISFLEWKFIPFLFVLYFFTAKAGIVLNLFLNFEQNELRVLIKLFLRIL